MKRANPRTSCKSTRSQEPHAKAQCSFNPLNLKPTAFRAAGVLHRPRGVGLARQAAPALPERHPQGLDALRAPEQHRGQGLHGRRDQGHVALRLLTMCRASGVTR